MTIVIDVDIASTKVTFTEMLVEAQREINLRQRVYPGLIHRKKMTEREAQVHLHRMMAMARFFAWAVPREAELRKLHGDE